MKALPLILIAIAGVCSYYAGTFSRAAPGVTKHSPSPTRVTALSRADGTASARSIAKLFKTRPTRHRALTIVSGILELDVDELTRLWDAEHSNFDYNNGNDNKIARAILRRLSELDPELALEKLNDAGAVRNALLPEVLAGWATTDSDAAVGWCRANRNERAAPSCIGAILDQIGSHDRDTAVDLYLELKGDDSLPKFNWNASLFFSRWAKTDPQAAMDSAMRIHSGVGSNHPMRHAIEAWAKFDSAAAANWALNESPESARRHVLEHLMAGWAELEPQQAADFALTHMAEDKWFSSYMVHALDGWTHNDFAGAASWVDSVTDPNIRAQLQQTLIERSRRYADSEPALDYVLANLRDNSALLDAAMIINRDLADSDPAAALAWGEDNLDNPRHAQIYRRSILSHLGRHQPETAASLISELPEDLPNLSQLHKHTATNWATADPTAARTWVDSLPDGDAKNAAMLGYASGWMRDRTQLAAASAWVKTFPPGDLRDQLGDNEARAYMDSHQPQNAIDAAAQIGDPFVRDQTFEHILKSWYRDEIKAEAAREFIESTDLISDTVRWRVLNRKNGHP